MAAKEAKIPNYAKFALGGTAGMLGALFVQPMEVLKNRMQVAKGKEYTSSGDVLMKVIKTDGILGLWSGVSAALLRQATYTTTRLGIYTWLLESMTVDGKPPGFTGKAALGMFAGMCGAFAGTPADIALVRMAADGRLPLNERRNYKNVFDAMLRIYHEEGLLNLWRGALPTVGRAMAVNAAQLATYSQAKQMLITTAHLKEGIFLYFLASMTSGIVTTVVSMPVDIMKTRIQTMKIIDGKPEYAGPIDVLKKVVQKEGFFAMWKGFTPYYFRLGPHTVLMLVFLEQLTGAYYKHILGVEKGRSM